MHYYTGVTLPEQLEAFRVQYLEHKGWPRSFEERVPRDQSGPVPWITYPAIAFLSGIVRPEWRVFEFGTGNSTLWWSAKAAEIHSVDHNREWIDMVRRTAPANCHLHHVPENAQTEGTAMALAERYRSEISEPPPPVDPIYRRNAGLITDSFAAYAGYLTRFPTGTFDLVVIDGMARNLCAWMAAEWAHPKRCIVFDNSDRPEYGPAYAILHAKGYRRIDLWGPGPINPYEWCTTVFLQDLSLLP